MSRPTLPRRLAVAAAVFAAAFLIASVKQQQEADRSPDFAMFWEAGRLVLAGEDPYAAIQSGGPHRFDSGFLYPLPAALFVAPLAPLPLAVAGPLFAALAMAALALAMTRDGFHCLPTLMSLPALTCLATGQWAPLVAAAALTPAFAWAAAAKPTLGLAAFAANPSWRFMAIGVAAVIGSLLVMPDWPLRWWAAARAAESGFYHVPLLVPGGFLLVLAALRWRRRDARLLLAMSCVPQTMFFYDQMALGLLADSRKQALSMGLWSYGAAAIAFVTVPDGLAADKLGSFHYLSRVILWWYYVPALVVVLRRPNEGAAPVWVERLVQFAAGFRGRWRSGAGTPPRPPR